MIGVTLPLTFLAPEFTSLAPGSDAHSSVGSILGSLSG